MCCAIIDSDIGHPFNEGGTRSLFPPKVGKGWAGGGVEVSMAVTPFPPPPTTTSTAVAVGQGP